MCVRPCRRRTAVLFAKMRNPCDALPMANFSRSRSNLRAPRVSVTKPASFSIRISAVLQAVSTTGGRAQMAGAVPPGTLAELAVDTSRGRVCGLVEFLEAQTKGNQGFRFVAFSDDDFERLRSTMLAGSS